MGVSDKCCPELRLNEFNTLDVQVCRVVKGDRDRTPWLIAVVAVLRVPATVSHPSRKATFISNNHYAHFAARRM